MIDGIKKQNKTTKTKTREKMIGKEEADQLRRGKCLNARKKKKNKQQKQWKRNWKKRMVKREEVKKINRSQKTKNNKETQAEVIGPSNEKSWMRDDKRK